MGAINSLRAPGGVNPVGLVTPQSTGAPVLVIDR